MFIPKGACTLMNSGNEYIQSFAFLSGVNDVGLAGCPNRDQMIFQLARGELNTWKTSPVLMVLLIFVFLFARATFFFAIMTLKPRELLLSSGRGMLDSPLTSLGKSSKSLSLSFNKSGGIPQVMRELIGYLTDTKRSASNPIRLANCP